MAGTKSDKQSERMTIIFNHHKGFDISSYLCQRIWGQGHTYLGNEYYIFANPA